MSLVAKIHKIMHDINYSGVKTTRVFMLASLQEISAAYTDYARKSTEHVPTMFPFNHVVLVRVPI